MSSPAKKFSLEEYGVDLTAASKAGKLDPVIGREKEIERMIRILARKTKNNPLLLGEPGVGKTAVVEGLAERIVRGAVPRELAGKTVFSLNLGNLLAGTGYRGDFEQRLQDLIAELRKEGTDRLLFVDEIHLLGKAGKSEGGLDAGNLLKPLLARGELPCIGASTPAEWAEMVGKDPALERRFQPVDIPEPTPDEAFQILLGVRSRYERHHGVQITDRALLAAVELSVARMPNRRLPDKAFDLVDEGCAWLRMQQAGSTTAATAEIAGIDRQIVEARNRYDLEEYARLQYQVRPTLQGPGLTLDLPAIERVCQEACGSGR